MASQQNGANMLLKPPQGNPGRSRADLERHQIPSFHSQCHTPQTQRHSNNPVEQVGVSRTRSICPRYRAPRGQHPDCPHLNIIHERKAHKECEREKATQQAQYEASLVFNKPVAAAAAPYGLPIYPTGPASPPPSTWPTAVINLTDDAPALLPLPSIIAAPALPSSHQHVPATLEGLRGEQAAMSGTPPLQNEVRPTALRRSVTDRPPAPFARPEAHPSSPFSLTSYQPRLATGAGTPSSTVTHRDQRFGDPFELSSGLPLPDYPFTASARPTHIHTTDPRLNACRRSLSEVDRPLMMDRPSAPAS
ncbi:hypothetical protein BDV10DRAFT_188975 [Aspergillus recurvatus]